jgi:hypothetical protein
MKAALMVILLFVGSRSFAQDSTHIGYIPQGKDLQPRYDAQTWAGAIIYTMGIVAGGYMYRTFPGDDRRNAGTLFIAGGVGGLAMVIGSRIPPLGKKGRRSP